MLFQFLERRLDYFHYPNPLMRYVVVNEYAKSLLETILFFEGA